METIATSKRKKITKIARQECEFCVNYFPFKITQPIDLI